jgi:hypothetical protein
MPSSKCSPRNSSGKWHDLSKPSAREKQQRENYRYKRSCLATDSNNKNQKHDLTAFETFHVQT